MRILVLERDGYRCVYCGRSSKETALQVDHLVPRIRGGSDLPTNLATACFDCNNGKRALEVRPPEWFVPLDVGRPWVRHEKPLDEWRQLANRLWPDGMDMVEPAYGTGRFATVAWCAGLTVHLYRSPEAARQALYQINQSSCGHGCWHDHEFVDLTAPRTYVLEEERRRSQRRVEHFRSCQTCIGIFDGQAEAAAIARATRRIKNALVR